MYYKTFQKHPEQQHCPQLRSVSLLSQTVKFEPRLFHAVSHCPAGGGTNLSVSVGDTGVCVCVHCKGVKADVLCAIHVNACFPAECCTVA